MVDTNVRRKREKNRKVCVFVCFCVWVALPRRIIRRPGRRRIFLCCPETAICSTYYVRTDGLPLITEEIRLPCILEHTGVMMNCCTDIVSIVNVLCRPRIAVFRCVSISSTMLDNVQWTLINVFKILSPIVWSSFRLSQQCHLKHYQSQNKDNDKSAHLAQLFGPIFGLFIREWIITSIDVWHNQT